MKIAVLHRYPPDQVVGTNASFIEFLKRLALNKNTVYYLTYKTKTAALDVPRLVKTIEIPLSFNRGNVLDKIIKTWLWIFLTPFYVRNLIKTKGIDMVYCDDSVPIYGFLIKFFCPKVKVVIRLGDLQTAYSLWEKHKTLFNISQHIESYMWKKMDGIIAISEAFRDYIVGAGVNPKKVAVVEESINLDEKVYLKKKLNKKTTNILFHGSLVSCKGVETLLLAFRDLIKEDSKLKLIIAGGGNQEKLLKEIVKEKSINNVTFTGWYNHSSLREIMKKVDIGVVMRNSNLGNNFVVTTCLLENWKYKIPVVVPKLESFEQVVVSEENGLFFEPDSVKDLKKQIKKLIKNKDSWRKIGQNGYLTAKKIFDHKKIAQKMVLALKNLYEE